MEFDLLEKLGKIAGIAGITVGALVLIFGGIIQKNIFPKMDQKQGFRLIRTMIVAASIMAILGLAAWIYVETQKNAIEKQNEMVVKNITGTVLDHENNPLSNVQITVDEVEQLETSTDVDGVFMLEFRGKEKEHFNLVLKHKNYARIKKLIKVDFNSDNEDVGIENIKLTRMRVSEEEEEGNFVDMSKKEEAPSRKANTNSEQNSRQQTPQQSTTNITLIYSGDDMGCALNVTLNVGGQTITPTSSNVYLNNVPLGNQNYSISGLIDCGIYGSCNVSGQDILEITPNGRYYLVWLNDDGDAYCDAVLVSEAAFNILNGL